MITEEQYKEALKTIEGYVTQLSPKEPRYFVDERGGIAAVRDRHHKSYDAEYQGLHADTPDVIKYKHGYMLDGVWEMKKEDVDFLNSECDRLNDEHELKTGFVKIFGCDNASGFEVICGESELEKVAKEIYAEHPGADGYYTFTKFLWVKYPDNRPEQRLDSVVQYD